MSKLYVIFIFEIVYLHTFIGEMYRLPMAALYSIFYHLRLFFTFYLTNCEIHKDVDFLRRNMYFLVH